MKFIKYFFIIIQIRKFRIYHKLDNIEINASLYMDKQILMTIYIKIQNYSIKCVAGKCFKSRRFISRRMIFRTF